jgi:hypothetical protein
LKVAPSLSGRNRAASAGEDGNKPPLSALWAALQPGINCVVSFTNPVFLWTPTGRSYVTYQGPLSVPPGSQVEIRPGNPHIDPELVKEGKSFFFSEGWTGTGETFEIHPSRVSSRLLRWGCRYEFQSCGRMPYLT